MRPGVFYEKPVEALNSDILPYEIFAGTLFARHGSRGGKIASYA